MIASPWHMKRRKVLCAKLGKIASFFQHFRSTQTETCGVCSPWWLPQKASADAALEPRVPKGDASGHCSVSVTEGKAASLFPKFPLTAPGPPLLPARLLLSFL